MAQPATESTSPAATSARRAFPVSNPGEALLEFSHACDEFQMVDSRCSASGARGREFLLKTRPVYHRANAGVRGHLFCSILASVLRRELRQRGRGGVANIMQHLRWRQEIVLETQGKRFAVRSWAVGWIANCVRAHLLPVVWRVAVGVTEGESLREVAIIEPDYSLPTGPKTHLRPLIGSATDRSRAPHPQ